MPLYEYVCYKCGNSFELLRRMNDDDREVRCPECGSERTGACSRPSPVVAAALGPAAFVEELSRRPVGREFSAGELQCCALRISV